jgi:ribonuclease HI
MELTAVIMGLQALKEPCRVKLYSDSEYVVNAMTQGWVQNWVKKGWKKVKNPDLWKQLVEVSGKHQIEFNWVKGHAGILENERCDQLATMASRQPNLPADINYEDGINSDDSESQPDSGDIVAAQTSKISAEWQPCRKCSTPVIKKNRAENKPVKPGAVFYYEYFFICPGCGTMYYTDEAKVFVR